MFEAIEKNVEKTETLYFTYDGLGSVTGLVAENGHLISKQTYDEFGIPHPSVNLSKGNSSRLTSYFGYTGEFTEEEAELLYLRARYYMPEVGRFVSRDPWPGFLENPRSYNPYVYCENNPLIKVDRGGDVGTAAQYGEWYARPWKKVDNTWLYLVKIPGAPESVVSSGNPYLTPFINTLTRLVIVGKYGSLLMTIIQCTGAFSINAVEWILNLLGLSDMAEYTRVMTELFERARMYYWSMAAWESSRREYQFARPRWC
jgi:RHS repeat-associated protein